VLLAQGNVAAAAADLDRVAAIQKDYWSDTGFFVDYFAGHIDKALAMTDSGIKGDSGYQYWWLWKALALKAQHDEAGAQQALADGLQKLGDSDWPAPILKFAAGKISEAEFRRLANADPSEEAGRLCEYDFYRGELAYLAGDRATTREAMGAAIASRNYDYLEYDGAQARLALLNQ
jgi:lipoprotein NlpI